MYVFSDEGRVGHLTYVSKRIRLVATSAWKLLYLGSFFDARQLANLVNLAFSYTVVMVWNDVLTNMSQDMSTTLTWWLHFLTMLTLWISIVACTPTSWYSRLYPHNGIRSRLTTKTVWCAKEKLHFESLKKYERVFLLSTKLVLALCHF